MGDSCIDTVIITSCTSAVCSSLSALFSSPHPAEFLDQPFPRRLETTGPVVQALLGSQKGCDTPLSPSHAGDKGYAHDSKRIAVSLEVNQKTLGHRHVDIVVLPRPSAIEEGKAAVSAPSNDLLEKNVNQKTNNDLFGKNPSRAQHDWAQSQVLPVQDCAVGCFRLATTVDLGVNLFEKEVEL